MSPSKTWLWRRSPPGFWNTRARPQSEYRYRVAATPLGVVLLQVVEKSLECFEDLILRQAQQNETSSTTSKTLRLRESLSKRLFGFVGECLCQQILDLYRQLPHAD